MLSGQKAVSIICVDQRSEQFVCNGLLEKDSKLVKQHKKDFKFLDSDRDLWKILVKKFK